MRTFIRLREALHADERIRLELKRIDTVVTDHDEKINALFLLVDELTQAPTQGDDYSSRKVGFFRDE